MANIQLDSIIKDIENRINSTDVSPERVNTGEVVYLGDGIARVVGLKDVAYNEVVEFENGGKGVALSLEEYSVGVVILQGFNGIKEGMIVKSTGKILTVPVGPKLLGRIVDALGNPLDGLGDIE